MKAGLALVAGVLAGSVLGQGAPVAWAAFNESAVASATIAADVLAPPSSLAVSAPYCVAGSHAVDVAWTASASDWLDGYEVLLATSAQGPFAVVATGDPSVVARTLTALERKTTYHVVVASTRSSWRATTAAVSVTTPPRNCA